MGWRSWANFIAICGVSRALHWLLGMPWTSMAATVVMIVAAMIVIVNAIRKDVG